MHHRLKTAKDWAKENGGQGQHITMDPSQMTAPSGGQDTQCKDHDYFLVDLAEGVRREKFPKGAGALALTSAVIHAVDNQHNNVMLSETREYIEQYNLHDLSQQHDVQAMDLEANGRMKPIINEYHKDTFESDTRK